MVKIRFPLSRTLLIVAGALASSLATIARAQSTESKIRQAVDLYNKLEIEAARPLLQEVLSPSWLQPISNEQRVTAYKYLGASYAVIQKPDSAVIYFTAALAYDAFTDLDRTAFSALELAAFDLAKTKLFRVGMRPLTSKVVDPKSTDLYPIRITTTQRAEVTVIAALKASPTRDSLSEAVFRGTNDGTQGLAWRGTIGGQIAPPGNYVMRITARTPGPQGETVTDSLDFQIQHSHEPLEDPLPALRQQDTLVASYSPRDPLKDLIKGAALGLAAAAIPQFALDRTKVDQDAVSKWNMHWTIASGVAVGSGLFAYSYRRQRLLKTNAVDENNRRRQKWLEYNAGVQRRNLDRLDKTKLIITPR